MTDGRKNLTSPNGDVRTFLPFRKAMIIYDLTFHFAHTFLARNDRTVDQMIQAARSGKQNIAEGSAAGVTSMETAIKLTNVAKASFLELLLDYEDFLRVHDFRQWEKDSEEVRFLRQKSTDPAVPDRWFVDLAKTRPAETVANMAIVFLHQEDYLLQAQLDALERKFLSLGGFREQMFAARSKARNEESRKNKGGCEY
ncbi:MAG: four helix bundle suffix domain-containing protein [Lentisphaeria bacterium]|nr:four helix bundle suffix domain-containing protein [Lentisphaeria bacterium]